MYSYFPRHLTIFPIRINRPFSFLAKYSPSDISSKLIPRFLGLPDYLKNRESSETWQHATYRIFNFNRTILFDLFQLSNDFNVDFFLPPESRSKITFISKLY